ncbi:hypothetical protein BDV93DRAFT_259678 [Ceratobasidium sp. AG-I]|nr:hypothetical protein BDV93DRAFT_259678 [Ceratobasidium sp. AG-I]
MSCNPQQGLYRLRHSAFEWRSCSFKRDEVEVFGRGVKSGKAPSSRPLHTQHTPIVLPPSLHHSIPHAALSHTPRTPPSPTIVLHRVINKLDGRKGNRGRVKIHFLLTSVGTGDEIVGSLEGVGSVRGLREHAWDFTHSQKCRAQARTRKKKDQG